VRGAKQTHAILLPSNAFSNSPHWLLGDERDLTLRPKGAFAAFVLDGHHKLHAYTQCNVPPWRIEIVAQNPRPTGDTRGFFSDERGYRAYRTAKRGK
jgi:hypothetical protein